MASKPDPTAFKRIQQPAKPTGEGSAPAAVPVPATAAPPIQLPVEEVLVSSPGAAGGLGGLINSQRAAAPVVVPAAAQTIRRINVELTIGLHAKLKAFGDKHNLFNDQVLANAMTHHGETAVEQLKQQPDADRRRKGPTEGQTTFMMRLGDHERLAAMLAELPGVTMRRFVSLLLELELGEQ